MKITFLGAENYEPSMIALMLGIWRRFSRQQHVQSVDIHVSQRDKVNGWLEFLTIVKFEDGSKVTMGAIQRTVDSEPEFHS